MRLVDGLLAPRRVASVKQRQTRSTTPLTRQLVDRERPLFVGDDERYHDLALRVLLVVDAEIADPNFPGEVVDTLKQALKQEVHNN